LFLNGGKKLRERKHSSFGGKGSCRATLEGKIDAEGKKKPLKLWHLKTFRNAGGRGLLIRMKREKLLARALEGGKRRAVI